MALLRSTRIPYEDSVVRGTNNPSKKMHGFYLKTTNNLRTRDIDFEWIRKMKLIPEYFPNTSKAHFNNIFNSYNFF